MVRREVVNGVLHGKADDLEDGVAEEEREFSAQLATQHEYQQKDLAYGCQQPQNISDSRHRWGLRVGRLDQIRRPHNRKVERDGYFSLLSVWLRLAIAARTAQWNRAAAVAQISALIRGAGDSEGCDKEQKNSEGAK